MNFHRTCLCSFLSVAFMLAATGLARAKTFDLYESKLSGAKDLQQVVKKFRPGDTVIFHPLEGSTRDFHLGKEMGKGDFGRVFHLEGSHPSQVVKFQRGFDVAQRVLGEEKESHDYMVKRGIPHAVLVDGNPKLFLIKEEIDGHTLEYIQEHWLELSRKERVSIVSATAKTIAAIQRAPLGLADIHSGNLMYDRVHKRVVVIDPGAVVNKASSFENELEESLSSSDDFGKAYRLHKSAPKWMPTLFSLQEATTQAIQKPSLEATRQILRLLGPLDLSKKGVPGPVQDQMVDSVVVALSSRQLTYDEIESAKGILQQIVSRASLESHAFKSAIQYIARDERNRFQQCLAHEIGQLTAGAHH